MDYGKNGNPKAAKDSHHPLDQPRRGAPKGDDKAMDAVLERLATVERLETELSELDIEREKRKRAAIRKRIQREDEMIIMALLAA